MYNVHLGTESVLMEQNSSITEHDVNYAFHTVLLPGLLFAIEMNTNSPMSGIYELCTSNDRLSLNNSDPISSVF